MTDNNGQLDFREIMKIGVYWWWWGHDRTMGYRNEKTQQEYILTSESGVQH